VSFLSILKNVGTVALGIEHIAAPIISATVPGAGIILSRVDSIVSLVQSGIQRQEITNPATASGPDKALAVANDFEAGLAITNEVMATQGKTMVYDKVALKTAIDAQVAAYNAMAAVKASMRMVDLPK